MDFNLKTALHQSPHWRLYTTILKDEEFSYNFFLLNLKHF